MLGHEANIVQHGYIAQGKLYRVARDAGPVALKVRVDALLGNAENTTSKVEQDLPDAPALGALVLRIVVQLWRVLDERHKELDVRDGIDDIEPGPGPPRVSCRSRVLSGNEDDDADNRQDGASGHTEDQTGWSGARRALKPPQRRKHVLRRRDGADDHGV